MAKRTKKAKNDDAVRVLTGTDGKKTVISTTLKLANPVTEMANKIIALLKYVPDVSTEFNYDMNTLWIYVGTSEKEDALRRFLVGKHEFGGLTLNVKLVAFYQGKTEDVPLPPAYTVTDEERVRLFKVLFKDCAIEPTHISAVDQYKTVWNFFMFPDFGVEFQNDNLGNPYGYSAMLVADLVKEVFDVSRFHVSTEPPMVA